MLSASSKSSGCVFMVTVTVSIFASPAPCRVDLDHSRISREEMLGHIVVSEGHAIIAEELVLDIAHDLGILVDLGIDPDGPLVAVRDDLAIHDDRGSGLHDECSGGERLLDLVGFVRGIRVEVVYRDISVHTRSKPAIDTGKPE